MRAPVKNDLNDNEWIPVTVPGNFNDYEEFTADVRESWYRKLFILPDRVENAIAVRLGEITDSEGS